MSMSMSILNELVIANYWISQLRNEWMNYENMKSQNQNESEQWIKIDYGLMADLDLRQLQFLLNCPEWNLNTEQWILKKTEKVSIC